MPRVPMTPRVRLTLYALLAYIVVLLGLLVVRFVQMVGDRSAGGQGPSSSSVHPESRSGGFPVSLVLGPDKCLVVNYQRVFGPGEEVTFDWDPGTGDLLINGVSAADPRADVPTPQTPEAMWTKGFLAAFDSDTSGSWKDRAQRAIERAGTSLIDTSYSPSIEGNCLQIKFKGDSKPQLIELMVPVAQRGHAETQIARSPSEKARTSVEGMLYPLRLPGPCLVMTLDWIKRSGFRGGSVRGGPGVEEAVATLLTLRNQALSDSEYVRAAKWGLDRTALQEIERNIRRSAR